MNLASRILLALLAVSGAAQAGDVPQLGPLHAAPGEAASGYFEVPPLNDTGARIPASLVRGTRDGPMLAMVSRIAALP